MPLINLKIPIGHKLSPQLEIYNPHDTVLKVKEMFTNQGFLHLTLPKGKTPAKGGKGGKGGLLWEIPPLTGTKVMSVSFHATRAGEHKGFVHVRTNIDTLVVPVEVQVIKGGVHRWPDLLDFKTLTSSKEKQERQITVLNATPKPLAVTDVVLSSADALLQIVSKRGIVLQPNSEAVVATVFYSGKTEGTFAGKLMVRTNDTAPENKVLEVPYQATVVHGRLAFNEANTTFAVTLPRNSSSRSPPGKVPRDQAETVAVVERELRLTNHFAMPLYLVTAVVEDEAFEVVTFPAERTLHPRETAAPLIIRYTADLHSLARRLSPENASLPGSTLVIYTNMSVFTIPLRVYHGGLHVAGSVLERVSSSSNNNLDVAAPDSTVSAFLMDVGMVGVKDERVLSLNISNPNPVPIDIRDLEGVSAKAAGMSVRVLQLVDESGAPVSKDAKSSLSALTNLIQGKGKGKGKGKAADKTPKSADKSPPVATIKAGQTLCLEVRILSKAEERVDDSLKVWTDYETVVIRLRYNSMQGSLTVEPAHLQLPPAFPGNVVSEAVYATSTYKMPLTITGMTSSETRLQARLAAAHVRAPAHAHNSTPASPSTVSLQPGVRTLIGVVSFDPSLGPPDENYMASAVWTRPQQQKDVLTGDGVVRASDLQQMEKLSLIWERVSAAGNISATITIDSNVVKGTTMTASATLQRPDVLSAGRDLSFPLTQVGQASEKHVSVENPSDSTMLAQLLLAPGKSKSAHCTTAPSQACTASAHFLTSRAHMAGVFVPPRSWARLGPVFFVPKAEGVYMATAYVRTNLTYLYAVGLRGEGGSGKLELSEEGVSGSETCDVLRFHVGTPMPANPLAHTQGIGSEDARTSSAAGASRPHHDHVSIDHVSTSSSAQGASSFRLALAQNKVLTLRNPGSLPVHVYSLALEGVHGEQCEWQGLKIHQCSTPFEIQPASNSSLRLSFTPDCTSWSTRVDLVAYTSVGTLRRKVVAAVAEAELEACYRRISRVGVGGLLRGARHLWLCRALGLFLVCVAVLVAREWAAQLASRPRPLRHAASSAGNAAGRPREDGKATAQGSTNSDAGDHHHAAALAHMMRLSCRESTHAAAGGKNVPGTKPGSGAAAAPKNKSAASNGSWGGGPKDAMAKDAMAVKPGARQASGRAGASDKTDKGSKDRDEQNGARQSSSAAARQSSTSASDARIPRVSSAGTGGAPAAKSDAKRKGGKGPPAQAVVDERHEDDSSWVLAGAPKSAKAAANRDKSKVDAVPAARDEVPTLALADAGPVSDAFPPVTGRFDMVQDPVFPAAAAAWNASGQAGGAGGLAFFGGLDSPFAHNLNAPLQGSLSPSTGWPSGGMTPFFGAMPCDPAASFQSPSMHLMGAHVGAGVAGGGAGAAADGDLDLSSVFALPSHMPVADFPLED